MKECTHCGGPNAPENRICDYCGMGFDEETIPEGSVDPREQAKLDAEAMREAMREKDLVEFNLDKSTGQNVTINTPSGKKIVINDPVEKAAALAGTVLTGSAASTLKKVGEIGKNISGLNIPGLEDDPRFGPGSSPKRPSTSGTPGNLKKKAGCLGCGVLVMLMLLALGIFMFWFG